MMSIRVRRFQKFVAIIFSGIILVSLAGCSRLSVPSPPNAKIIPRADTLFGDVRVDNYYWLKNREDSSVINYIKAENAYTQKMTAHLMPLENKLYDEMVERLKETDTSAAQKIDDYFYYTRTDKGQQYPVYCRKQGNLSNKEEVLLDLNILDLTQKYINLGAFKVSPDHHFLAYAIDTSGSESYAIHFKNLQTDQPLPDVIVPAGSDIEWGNDNKTIFYETLDNTQRPFKMHRHLLGMKPENDTLLFKESDEAYYLSISKTRSKQFIVLNLESNTTDELWTLDADKPLGQFKVVVPRKHDVKYYLDHSGTNFFIMTNENAKNFKIMKTPTENPVQANWTEYIGQDDSVKIEGIDSFKKNLVVYERSGGLPQIKVINLDNNEGHNVAFPDPAYSIYQGSNPVYDTAVLRFRYSSLGTPFSVYDYNMDTRKLELVKRNEVKGFDQTKYSTERIFARASDSVMVPIVLIYKKDLFKGDGTNPLMLEGYGAYGISSDPDFS
jgi:oligopeptidase B